MSNPKFCEFSRFSVSRRNRGLSYNSCVQWILIQIYVQLVNTYIINISKNKINQDLNYFRKKLSSTNVNTPETQCPDRGCINFTVEIFLVNKLSCLKTNKNQKVCCFLDAKSH